MEEGIALLKVMYIINIISSGAIIGLLAIMIGEIQYLKKRLK